MEQSLSALSERDAEISRIVATTDAQLSDAAAFYRRAGLLEANAVLFDIINPVKALAMRAQAEGHRATAAALSREALLGQLEGSVRDV